MRWLKRLAFVILAPFFIYQLQTVTAAPPRQGPAESPSLIRGAAFWLENCAPCHGTAGRGDGPTAAALEYPPANFADPVAAKTRSLAGMFDVASNGRIERLMPPWKDELSEQEIWDVVAYAQSLSVNVDDLDAGAAIYAESCASCHGENGFDEAIDLTRPGSLAESTGQALFDSLRAAEGDHESLAGLSDEALWQGIAFAQTLSLEMPSLDGELRGWVRNGTTGGAIANIEMTLYALTADSEVLRTYSGVSDADGAFIFTNLNTDQTISYALEGIHQEVSYVSPEPITFLADTPNIEQDLVVYETTGDPQFVTQQRLHRIMGFGAGQISLADVYVFENTGDRTFIGEAAADGLPATVKIGLPVEAINVAFQNNAARFVDGYYLGSRPIIPGQETFISAMYTVPAAEDDYRLETPLFYDVPIVNVLATDQGQIIESQQLTFDGVDSFQGSTYQLLSGSNLAANQPLVMEIKGLASLDAPAPSSSNPGAVVRDEAARDQTLLLWSILGLGGVVLVFSLLYSNRNTPAVAGQVNLAEEKRRLVALLAELEILHRSGEIDEPMYQQLRVKHRALLKQTLTQLHEAQI